jgi:hypothetical protein
MSKRLTCLLASVSDSIARFPGDLIEGAENSVCQIL